jgi:hypothetical protein
LQRPAGDGAGWIFGDHKNFELICPPLLGHHFPEIAKCSL